MRDPFSRQAARDLAQRLKTLGARENGQMNPDDRELCFLSAGYLMGLALRAEDADRLLLARDIPPHCETCRCEE